MNTEMADLLDTAADKTERDGWYQDDFYPGAGGQYVNAADLPVCARGALLYAQGGYESPYAHEVICEAVCSVLGLGRGSVDLVTWNDKPGRTKQEVLDALRLAAKQERS